MKSEWKTWKDEHAQSYYDGTVWIKGPQPFPWKKVLWTVGGSLLAAAVVWSRV